MLSKALGGGIAVCVIIIGLLWNQNGKLHETVGLAEAAVLQAKQTNTNNLTTIADLGDRLEKCVRDREVDITAGEAVVSALKADILGLENRDIEVRIQREEIFREPSCKELGELDINAICPRLASSMRERANSIN